MSEARTDPTQTRPADAHRVEDDGYGKHRGGESMDDTSAQPHGRHRRPSEGDSRAA
ncbi:hypothetical protein [Streptomyces sp. NBC_00893]|uniref:hypothetical protein n=1 Tax=Streptomyces sp. NBC_00893 TaxID=2975862 RepID=UPI00224E4E88|nr:hypothetical protein [Streptomyces sp. NBC_00893]MCX4848299.1 hypothetical protein [Streptomyces sp. NBC_00893]